MSQQAKRSSYPNLKAWREDHKLNHREAAEVLLLDRSFYSKLEKQVAILSGPRAKPIADTTGVPLAILVGAV